MTINPPLLVDIGQGLSIMVGLPTIDSWNTKDRPIKPKKGTFGYNYQTKKLEYFDGKDWYCASMKVC